MKRPRPLFRPAIPDLWGLPLPRQCRQAGWPRAGLDSARRRFGLGEERGHGVRGHSVRATRRCRLDHAQPAGGAERHPRGDRRRAARRGGAGRRGRFGAVPGAGGGGARVLLGRRHQGDLGSAGVRGGAAAAPLRQVPQGLRAVGQVPLRRGEAHRGGGARRGRGAGNGAGAGGGHPGRLGAGAVRVLLRATRPDRRRDVAVLPAPASWGWDGPTSCC